MAEGVGGVMKHWRDDEAVDGSGMTVTEAGAAMASELSVAAAEHLCAELRNALVPLRHAVSVGDAGRAEKILERMEALADACAARAREP